MQDVERYENLVLGNGTSGKYLAWERRTGPTDADSAQMGAWSKRR